MKRDSITEDSARVHDGVSLPRRIAPAYRIKNDEEALACATALASFFSLGAEERDRVRRLPMDEVEKCSQSGLLAISVPRIYGGAGVSYATLAKVVRIISAADPNIGQIAQVHFFLLEMLRWGASEAQQRRYFGAVLAGDRVSNAIAEASTKSASQQNATIRSVGRSYTLSGTKSYCTGALLAHWVAPLVRTEEGEQRFVMICRNAQNLALKNDWSGFGQRTSASGTTVLDNVTVSAEAVFNGPAGHFAMLGVAIFQILHAAVDAGIAQASIDDSVNCLRDLARPWAAAGIERASDDPLSLRSLGMLQAHAHAADALLERGAHSIDEAAIEPCERLSAEAAIAALEAKSFAAEIAVDAANMLFEFGGARSTLARFGYDRHWRNARTHSLHDPVRWRQYEIGNFLVNGEIPAAAYRSRPS